MTGLKKVLDQILAWVCIVLFATLVLVVVWQVFTRQVLADPSTWTSVFAQYTFVWLALFGSAYVFSEQGHIAVDFVVNRFGAGAQRAVRIFVQVVILLFAASALIWGGIRGVGITWDQNVAGLPFTVGNMYLALPISGALIAFYALYHLIKVITGRDLLEASDAPLSDADAPRGIAVGDVTDPAAARTKAARTGETQIPHDNADPSDSRLVDGADRPPDGTDRPPDGAERSRGMTDQRGPDDPPSPGSSAAGPENRK